MLTGAVAHPPFGEVSPVAYGQIRRIDPQTRTAVIAFDSGRETHLTFAPDANIEVIEPATLGTMGGTLEDLKVGYWVEADVRDQDAGGCSCHSLICLS